jgi:hypothetical protein
LADLEDDAMETKEDNNQMDRPIPDATTKDLYESATPYIRAILDQPDSRNEEAKTKLVEINEKIEKHNATILSEGDAALLVIDDDEFNGLSQDTAQQRKELQKDPSNRDLRGNLDKANNKLLSFIKERHYPDH